MTFPFKRPELEGARRDEQRPGAWGGGEMKQRIDRRGCMEALRADASHYIKIAAESKVRLPTQCCC